MRVLGLDYGSKTVGVAVSDPLGWTAQGIETIHRKEENNLKSTITRLTEIINEYNIEKIVLGLPKNMNNTCGERVDRTLYFKDRLIRELSLPVETWDERLSTMGAKRSMLEADLSRMKQKKIIDKMAAVYILQGYLDCKM
ncbi:Holliday junction resolvase RuvX [Vallitalea pronyensis]|uniref:Putative pre-16S rRNA nuclease n=1 Tax=Vallitalea pronyensis TaxID=1348613 RepID=A0A8J8SHW9_9FIRM|nr:Holliday junction resolvase RuvX [Vallitalea pronyensis]QUI23864.1 Holliday junction resolvase RuvX [Vallitalea pronyensis]